MWPVRFTTWLAPRAFQAFTIHPTMTTYLEPLTSRLSNTCVRRSACSCQGLCVGRTIKRRQEVLAMDFRNKRCMMGQMA